MLRGVAAIEGHDGFAGRRLEVDFQNEFTVCSVEGVPRVMTPDLICVLDTVSGEAIGTETLRYGQRATVIALPAAPEGEAKKKGEKKKVNVDDLRDTVIGQRGGVPLHLSEIADVRESTAIRRGIARLNGWGPVEIERDIDGRVRGRLVREDAQDYLVISHARILRSHSPSQASCCDAGDEGNADALQKIVDAARTHFRAACRREKRPDSTEPSAGAPAWKSCSRTAQ